MDKPAKRGRPPKYGRAADVVTMTLPHDVIEWLQRIHADPAWAVVRLFERAQRLGAQSAAMRPPADLVPLPRHRSLILVRPEIFSNLQGVAVIPLADGRGFLALEDGGGLPSLEVALMDRIESDDCLADEREALLQVRQTIKQWRQQGLKFETRSIIVGVRSTSRTTNPLPELAKVG